MSAGLFCRWTISLDDDDHDDDENDFSAPRYHAVKEFCVLSGQVTSPAVFNFRF